MTTTKVEWTDEVWNPVPTHPGYEASDQGQIRGPSGRILRPMRMPSGHLFVLTPRPRHPRKLFVHRAVLFAFVGPPAPGQEARHLNGNPSDNRLDNLAWGTRVEQRNDARRHGTLPAGDRSAAAKLTQAQVFVIRELRQSRTLRSLAAEFGVSHTAIRRACDGVTWGALGW